MNGYTFKKKVTLTIASKNQDPENAKTDIGTLLALLTSDDWKSICCKEGDPNSYPELANVDVFIKDELTENFIREPKPGDNALDLDPNLGIENLDKLDGFKIQSKK